MGFLVFKSSLVYHGFSRVLNMQKKNIPKFEKMEVRRRELKRGKEIGYFFGNTPKHPNLRSYNKHSKTSILECFMNTS